MYYIINRTTNITTKVSGGWPDLDPLLNLGDDIIVISTYSNTIKVPFIESVEYNVNVWEWKEYRLPALP